MTIDRDVVSTTTKRIFVDETIYKIIKSYLPSYLSREMRENIKKGNSRIWIEYTIDNKFRIGMENAKKHSKVHRLTLHARNRRVLSCIKNVSIRVNNYYSIEKTIELSTDVGKNILKRLTKYAYDLGNAERKIYR